MNSLFTNHTASKIKYSHVYVTITSANICMIIIFFFYGYWARPSYQSLLSVYSHVLL